MKINHILAFALAAAAADPLINSEQPVKTYPLACYYSARNSDNYITATAKADAPAGSTYNKNQYADGALPTNISDPLPPNALKLVQYWSPTRKDMVSASQSR